MARYDTTELIPTNGVYISDFSKNLGMPRGWMVGRYDAKGFIQHQMWFQTARDAEDYAEKLDGTNVNFPFSGSF